MSVESLHVSALGKLNELLSRSISEYELAYNELKALKLSPEIEDRWIEVFNLRVLIDIFIQQNEEILDAGILKVLSDLYVSVLSGVINTYDQVEDVIMDCFGKDLLQIPEGVIENILDIRKEVSVLCDSVVNRLFPRRSIRAFSVQFERVDLSLFALPVSNRNFLEVLALRQFPITYYQSFDSSNEDEITKLKRNVLISNLDFYTKYENLTEHENKFMKNYISGNFRAILRPNVVAKCYEMIAVLLRNLDEMELESSGIFIFGEQISHFTNKHDYVVLFLIVANSIVNFDDQMSCSEKESKEYVLWKNCKILLDSIRSNLKLSDKTKKKRRRR